MQIQIRTDKNIVLSPERKTEIEGQLNHALERFGEWLTRVEVTLSDESSAAKHAGDDKRCVIEARPAGMQPIAVSHDGSNLEQAVVGCVKKIAKKLGDTKDKMDTSKGAKSFSGE